MSKWESNEEIQIFREYLRIPSVQPDVDYGKIIKEWSISVGQEWLLVFSSEFTRPN